MTVKRIWTKKEIIEELEPFVLDVSSPAKINPSPQAVNIILAVEREVYNSHVDSIWEKYSKLEKMWTDEHRFLAIWNGTIDDLSPGCNSCLSNTKLINHIRHASDCTQNCDFCYYRNRGGANLEWRMPKGTYAFSSQDDHVPPCTLQETKLIIEKQIMGSVGEYGAIGWLHKEPLLSVADMLPVMEYIAEQGLWQYLYTNGLAATDDVLQSVADAGLNEIRFNLQASDFNDMVIDCMGRAKDRMEVVCVETPMYSKSYHNFVSKRKHILSTGVDQLNLPELQAPSLEQYLLFRQSEGLMYKHRRGYVSPLSSRYLTADLIKLAEEEDWPVVINDCSNDTKYYRGVKGAMAAGQLAYESVYELPVGEVIELVEAFFEEEKEYWLF